MKKYLIETMGCQMNDRDSETLAGMIEEMGYERAADGRISVRSVQIPADLIVVNTCSVRENADNKFFGTLGQIKHIKENDPGCIVAVCGCMMQQPHIVERIKKNYPWVDIVFGTLNISEFPSMLKEAEQEKSKQPEYAERERTKKQKPRIEIIAGDGEVPELIPEGLPSRREHVHKALMSIMQGCNNFCSYCIVPYTRGRERSRPAEAIIKEAQALAADGVREVMLLGQNVNSYSGKLSSDESLDKGTSPNIDFTDLIYKIEKIHGIERIRFMTSHPKDLSDKLIDAFKETKHLCPHIHLPVQSGSSRILEKMNRRYTKENYLTLVKKLREHCPGIAITTDIIVGFPGESDADFEETMDVIEMAEFDAAFTFMFSPRKGTPAAALDERVPESDIKARFERMVKRLNEISLEKNKKLVGKTVTVLVDGKSKTDKDKLAGRTPDNRLVNFAGRASPGLMIPVKIISANTFSLTGTMLE